MSIDLAMFLVCIRAVLPVFGINVIFQAHATAVHQVPGIQVADEHVEEERIIDVQEGAIAQHEGASHQVGDANCHISQSRPHSVVKLHRQDLISASSAL